MKISIDNVMHMEILEGFRQMTEQELRAQGANMSDQGVVYKDEDSHILLQIFWKKIPLLGKNVPLEKTVELTAKQHRGMVPTYREHRDLENVIAGEKAVGFSYEYTVKDLEQVTVYYCLRYEKKYYAFSMTMRKENRERDAALFEEILHSVTMI